MKITIDLSAKEMTDIVAKAMRLALSDPGVKPDSATEKSVESLREAMRAK